MQDKCSARSEKEKTDTFAEHLSKVFKHNLREIIRNEKNRFLSDNTIPAIQDTPTSLFTVNEVKVVIKHLYRKKAPGYDLITNQVLQKLPETAIKYITQLCNAVLKHGFFLFQWKVAQIILIQKSGKPAKVTETYRSISLLPVLSKLFERLLMSSLNIIMENHGLIPDQFRLEINMQQQSRYTEL